MLQLDVVVAAATVPGLSSALHYRGRKPGSCCWKPMKSALAARGEMSARSTPACGSCRITCPACSVRSRATGCWSFLGDAPKPVMALIDKHGIACGKLAQRRCKLRPLALRG